MVINELWATVKGYDPSEIEPHVGSWEKLVHPEDLPVALRLHADHFAGRTDMYEATIRMRHKSGRWLWFSDKGRVVERDEAGNAIRACGTHQDITEARRLSERLRQAEKMESIGTLAGGIAHDFNNILGGIIGFADLGLNDAPPGSRLERYLNRILQGGNRARSLVKQILNFSRRSKEEKSPQYLRPIIKEVAELLRASLPSTIRIESRIDPDTRPVFADPTKIHEIVMNLCTNASQAMERETGILRISCEESSFDHEIVGRSGTVPAGMYSVITVQDNGCGMDTETVERLFEPFFTTKPEGEGTGMGMAVVFGIVQSHGGTVTVDSTVGEGTTVRVYLPKCIEEQSGEVVEALPVQGGNEKVLYIDDEEMMGELAKDMLSNLGYRVTVHVDGEAALEDFRRQPADFDIVITDQTMPVLPGMHMAREVRQIRSDIPVILCTGFSRQVNEQQAIAAGIDGFLSKPFRLREMAREIRYVLQQRKAC
jgi:PAS domain S-box-containing protein